MIYRFVYNIVTSVLETFLTPTSQILYLIFYHQRYGASTGNWYIKIKATYMGTKDCVHDGYRLRFVLNPSRMREPRILFPQAKYRKNYKYAFEWFHAYLKKAWGDDYIGLYNTQSGGTLFYSRLKQIRIREIQEWLIWIIAIIVTGFDVVYLFRRVWFISIKEYITGLTILQAFATFICYAFAFLIFRSLCEYYRKYRKHTETMQINFNSTVKNLSQDRKWYYSIH